MKNFKQSRQWNNSIREYIKREWGDNVAEAFDNKTIDLLDLLKQFLNMVHWK